MLVKERFQATGSLPLGAIKYWNCSQTSDGARTRITNAHAAQRPLHRNDSYSDLIRKSPALEKSVPRVFFLFWLT